jgi:hypothetical protein
LPITENQQENPIVNRLLVKVIFTEINYSSLNKIVMKRVFMVLLIAVTAHAFCQQTDSLNKSVYLQKSKHQKTGAWVMLGGGVATAIAGIIIFDHAYKKAAENDPFGTLFSFGTNVDPAGGYIFLVGSLSAVGSIPLFIASSKNKRKALSVSFKNEKASFIVHANLVNKSIPALSVKINL